MAISNKAVTVGTTPTHLTAEGHSHQPLSTAVSNVSGVTVYLGDAAVTTANGYPLGAGREMSLDLANTTEELYAVVATGTAEVRTLSVGAQ